MHTSNIKNHLRRTSCCIALLTCSLYTGLLNAAPHIEHWVTSTGTRVFFVETRVLPIIDIQLDFAAGASQDPVDKAGLAQLTHTLLDLGAGEWDEVQIAGKLAEIGAQLTGSSEIDRASIRLRTLATEEKREVAFDILRQILTQPRFPEAIFERERTRTISALRESLTRPESVAARAFWSALYGDHPYGRQPDPDSLQRITIGDLHTFYRHTYTARNATLSIVGSLSKDEAIMLAEHLTAKLPEGSELPIALDPPQPQGREIKIAHPAAQAHILMGLPAIKRNDPDFYPLIVGNYTLGGGGFVSRLMQEVREKRGLAYSAYTYFAPMQTLGPFQLGLQTKRTQAQEALQLSRTVVQKFLTEGPSEAELKAAKQNIIGSFPLRLDSNRKLIDNLAIIGFYRLPIDYLDRYTEKIQHVSAADVKAAFSRRIQPEHWISVIVAGD